MSKYDHEENKIDDSINGKYHNAQLSAYLSFRLNFVFGKLFELIFSTKRRNRSRGGVRSILDQESKKQVRGVSKDNERSLYLSPELSNPLFAP